MQVTSRIKLKQINYKLIEHEGVKVLGSIGFVFTDNSGTGLFECGEMTQRTKEKAIEI